MTARYVDNAQGEYRRYDQFDLYENVSYAEDSTTITTAASLILGQTIQIDSSGEATTFEITDVDSPNYSVDRDISPEQPPDAGLYYTAKDGLSKTNAKTNINEVLADAVAGDTVYVKRNSVGYVLTNSDQMDKVVEPGMGDLKHKPIILEGYHTTEGDMRWGGAYYQSPLHAKVFGIDTTKKVTISGENALASLLKLNGSNFVIIRNFYFKDATGLILQLANTPSNVFFEHCIFADSGSVISGECNGFGFYDCYIKGMDYVVSLYTTNCTGAIGAKYAGNVLDIGNYTKYGFTTGSPNIEGINGLYYGNLIIGGAYPVLSRTGDTIINNTIYDSPCCIRLGINGQWPPVTIHNNIIISRLAADKGILIGGSTSGAIVHDNNCFWSVAGAPIDNPIVNDVPGGGAGVIGPNSIEVDPMLTSNYRPREPKVLRGGKPDIYGNAGQIGAVLSEHKFQRRPAMGRSATKRFFR